MSWEDLPPCARKCLNQDKPCKESDCRLWVDYPQDVNCTLVSIEENGEMTLSEVAKRIGVSLVSISQIEKKALRKISKKIKNDF